MWDNHWNPMVTPRNLIIIFLVLTGSITFLVYLPALDNGFVDWDDLDYVVANQHIRSLSLQSLHWMFFDYYAANWHPLTWLSLAVDYALWGLNPKGYHLTNIILHAINTMLVVVLARMLFLLTSGKPQRSLPFAVLVGLLFGLHPIHVESVAWVSERKDLLYCLFYLASIIFYLKHQADRRRLNYLLCSLMFVLSMLSKPMAISLPLVLMVLDYYPLGKLKLNGSSIRKSIWGKLPLFILASLLAVVTLVVQGKSGAMVSIEVTSIGERFLLSQWALMFYLYKTFIPFNYVYFYPMPPGISLLNFQYFIPLAANVSIAYTGYRLRSRLPLFTCSALVYLITLLPVIGLVQVGAQAAADRYMYLTLLVPILLAVSAIMYLEEKVPPGVRGKRVLYGTLIAVACTLLYQTTAQIQVWEDDTALADHAVKHSSENVRAYTKRAKEYLQLGMYREAIDDVNKVTEINTKYPRWATHTIDWDYGLRGRALMGLEKYDNAIHDLSKAIAVNDSEPAYYVNRAKAFEVTEQPRKALKDYLRSLELAPDNPGVHNNAALIQHGLGMYTQAIEHLDEAIRLEPDGGVFYYNRALNYNKLGDQDMIGKDLKKAAELGIEHAREVLGN